MRIRLCVVGRLKNDGLLKLCQDYERRIRRHCQFEQLEARDDAQLQRYVGTDDFVVALQVRGKQLTSTQFAERLQRWAEFKSGRIALVIGGANGIAPGLAARCDDEWSLSALTLPHRLARVLVCEQVYRATTLWRGEPYARED